MNKYVSTKIEIKENTIEVHASLSPSHRCFKKILVGDNDIISYLVSEGLQVSKVLSTPTTGLLKNYCSKEFLSGMWIFEKVVAKPKKKSYNSSKKKTVPVTPEE